MDIRTPTMRDELFHGTVLNYGDPPPDQRFIGECSFEGHRAILMVKANMVFIVDIINIGYWSKAFGTYQSAKAWASLSGPAFNKASLQAFGFNFKKV